MNAQKEEAKLLTKAADAINKNLIKEWQAQGHHLSGAWESSLASKIINGGNSLAILGTMAYYGSIVEQGVSKDRIPYGGHKATAGTSKYIQGLVSYFKARGLGEKEAIRAAFATAKTHKKEGMPTKGSYAYSKTGQRTKFIGIVDKAIGSDIDKMILDGLDAIVDEKFHEVKSETI